MLVRMWVAMGTTYLTRVLKLSGPGDSWARCGSREIPVIFFQSLSNYWQKLCMWSEQRSRLIGYLERTCADSKPILIGHGSHGANVIFIFLIIVIYVYFIFFRNKQVDEDGWKVVVVDPVAAVMGRLKRQRSKKKTIRGQYVMAVAITFDASSSGLGKQPKQVTALDKWGYWVLVANLLHELFICTNEPWTNDSWSIEFLYYFAWPRFTRLSEVPLSLE